jgi:hypothetical protein
MTYVFPFQHNTNFKLSTQPPLHPLVPIFSFATFSHFVALHLDHILQLFCRFSNCCFNFIFLFRRWAPCFLQTPLYILFIFHFEK